MSSAPNQKARSRIDGVIASEDKKPERKRTISDMSVTVLRQNAFLRLMSLLFEIEHWCGFTHILIGMINRATKSRRESESFLAASKQRVIKKLGRALPTLLRCWLQGAIREPPELEYNQPIYA